MSFVLSLDAGTTSVRALIINKKGEILATDQISFEEFYPEPGWVEHSPLEIWEKQHSVIQNVLKKSGISPKQIASIGIANQRETTLIWERASGKPISNAIVWSDRRTKEELSQMPPSFQDLIKQKTGLLLESYFSASKIRWLLNNVPFARQKALNGELCFGTINTWILWNLTKGEVFATDISNASRTLLFNIHTLSWDPELLQMFDIPLSLLPEVRSCSEIYGYTNLPSFSEKIPIGSMIGDQQAALFGNTCFTPGDLSCIFGTGAFILMLTGKTPYASKGGLLTSIGWQIGEESPEYILEGLVYAAGAVIHWLRDFLGIIESPMEMEGLAYSEPDTGGVVFVPAISGLATPYWNPYVRGTLLGITPSTNIGHIARASLEGIAFQVSDVVESMLVDFPSKAPSIKCAGGMSENVFLMEQVADLTGISILRSSNTEMTALGAGFLAGLSVGYWKSQEEIRSLWKLGKKFERETDLESVELCKNRWQHAIKTAEFWATKDS